MFLLSMFLFACGDKEAEDSAGSEEQAEEEESSEESEE